jgi:hypothetical protein
VGTKGAATLVNDKSLTFGTTTDLPAGTNVKNLLDATASAGDLTHRIEDAREALTFGGRWGSQVVAEAERLLAKHCSDDDFDKIIRHAFPELKILDSGTASGRGVTIATDKRDSLFDLFHGETVAGAGIGQTAWGAVQAVGERVDWYGSIKTTTDSVDIARARREFVAGGLQVETPKVRAYEIAAAL